MALTSRQAYFILIGLYVLLLGEPILYALRGEWAQAWEELMVPAFLVLGFVLGRVR